MYMVSHCQHRSHLAEHFRENLIARVCVSLEKRFTSLSRVCDCVCVCVCEYFNCANLHNPVVCVSRRKSSWETLRIGWLLLMQGEKEEKEAGGGRGGRRERRLRRREYGGWLLSECIFHRDANCGEKSTCLPNQIYILVYTFFSNYKIKLSKTSLNK